MLNRRPQRLDEAEVAAMSIALRHRAAEIKRTAPNQYEDLLKSGQTTLIPEPWGEPGRDSKKIDKRSEKPRGYNLQVAVGLKSSPALHNHYLATIGRIADQHLIYATRFSDQPRSMVMKVVLKVLTEEPIFHCYYDQWPIVSYIISHLNSQINQNRNAQKKIEHEQLAFGQTAQPEGNTQHSISQAPPNSQSPPPTPPPLADQARPPTPPNAPANDASEDDRMTPPAPPLPTRKRRGDPDRNNPGTRNKKAQKLKAQEDTSTHHLQPAETASETLQRRSARNRVDPSRNATPGPGPSSMLEGEPEEDGTSKRS
ncbi:hypothetical protein RhiJN_21255 [Ceratobasidium sp. AG-Ba]|nr:hypothetical protein RhiJN_21220 [Ceratobasidium sp. AG-Ba]QRV93237.1 hypothetical protein RhiJN_21255 [Ceratobasidium sp. AG-Ba]